MKTGTLGWRPAGRRGVIETSAASVSSAGMLSLSAGQLLNVMMGLTGSRLSRLRVAPNATEAGPRRSTSHIVPSGRPAAAT